MIIDDNNNNSNNNSNNNTLSADSVLDADTDIQRTTTRCALPHGLLAPRVVNDELPVDAAATSCCGHRQTPAWCVALLAARTWTRDEDCLSSAVLTEEPLASRLRDEVTRAAAAYRRRLGEATAARRGGAKPSEHKRKRPRPSAPFDERTFVFPSEAPGGRRHALYLQKARVLAVPDMGTMERWRRVRWVEWARRTTCPSSEDKPYKVVNRCSRAPASRPGRRRRRAGGGPQGVVFAARPQVSSARARKRTARPTASRCTGQAAGLPPEHRAQGGRPAAPAADDDADSDFCGGSRHAGALLRALRLRGRQQRPPAPGGRPLRAAPVVLHAQRLHPTASERRRRVGGHPPHVLLCAWTMDNSSAAHHSAPEEAQGSHRWPGEVNGLIGGGMRWGPLCRLCVRCFADCRRLCVGARYDVLARMGGQQRAREALGCVLPRPLSRDVHFLFGKHDCAQGVRRLPRRAARRRRPPSADAQRYSHGGQE
ncbi:Protein of unknown function [Gryllus bimaculatus]|nr:Protein of unknown function [Gryllus bimaculatus]